MRLLPLLAALCFLGVLLSLPAEDESRRLSLRAAGSSYETGPAGLSVARAYLASLPGAQVEVLDRPIGQARLPANAVVLRVLPTARGVGPSSDEVDVDEGPAADDDDDGAGEDEHPPVKKISAPGSPAPQPDRSPALDSGGRRDGERHDRPAVKESSGPESPMRAPRTLLGAAERRWLERGGRLVIATALWLPELEVTDDASGPVEKHLPLLPGVRLLEPSGRTALRGAAVDSSALVFSRGGAPFAVRRAVGKGELWLLAGPELLDNAHLAKADHLALLRGLAGDGRPLFFDETVHGLENPVGVGELLRRWGLGPAVVLAVVAMLLAFWRRRQLLGPPSPWEDRRTESVDLLESLAQLYRRALRPAQALDMHRQRLVNEVQSRSHLSPEALEARMGELLPRWPVDPGARMRGPEFDHRLAQLNAAFRRIRDARHRR